MTTDSTRNSPEPLAILRDYELLSRLGQGGMGAVYLARHSHLDKRVAIKLLPREHLRNPEMVARFKREMKAVGKLQHPNIIQAFDGGEEKGIHFLVLEYAEGLDLNVLLARYGKLPISDACEIIRQAAIGLQHAHLHGLVHRDIKPANILLAWPSRRAAAKSDSDDSDDAVTDEPRATVEWSGSDASSGLDMQPVAKVLDLGLALLNGDQQQSLAKGITGTGQIMGTLDYMAPEQTSDTHTVDIRADIYSLGCTLYALLAGRPPFAGEAYTNAYQKIVAHNQHSPRPLHEMRKNVPPAVMAILNKMLAKCPADRYATPIEVAAALAPYCQGHTLLSTLVEAEARLAEHKSRSDAATQDLNSSALQGTATGAADEDRYAVSTDDELLALLRPKAIDETIVTQPPKVPETRFQLNVPATPTVKQVRQTRALDNKQLRLQVLTAAACVVLAIVIAAVVLRIQSNYGTIELTLFHKDAQVTVDGHTVRLRPGTGDDEYLIRIAPGQRKLQVEKDGYITFIRDIEIAKGEKTLVAIKLLRNEPKVASTLRRAEPISPSVVPGATSNNSSNASPEGSSRRSVTATFEEPPPLDQWLEGREILTVKQDGTAMFTKIQDALDALKPGQVVEVLDKGPYVENLAAVALASDTGLISRVQSILNSPRFVKLVNNQAQLVGHELQAKDSFRLAGFAFGDTSTDDLPALGGSLVFVTSLRGFTIEDCFFDTTSTSHNRPANLHAVLFLGNGDAVLQDSIVLGRIGIHNKGSATIQRNLCSNHSFQQVTLGGTSSSCGTRTFQWNVIDSPQGAGPMVGHNIGECPQIVLWSNTIRTGKTSIDFTTSMPAARLIAERNIFVGWRRMQEVASPELKALQASWLFRNNAVSGRDESHAREIPLFPTEISVEPPFLSLNPADRDYMRVAPNGPFAPASDGTFLGALPPGPAPPEGDWFTRLQERWKVASTLRRDEPATPPAVPGATPASSSNSTPEGSSRRSVTDTFEEPPPLDQWLEGREILTVKQDGTAMFTKIQDALDALKPGQVVEVLDEGPYIEGTIKKELPRDSALVSSVGTRIILDKWEVGDSDSGTHYGWLLRGERGFRLSGIWFLCKDLPDNDPKVAVIVECLGALALDHCTIDLRQPHLPRVMPTTRDYALRVSAEQISVSNNLLIGGVEIKASRALSQCVVRQNLISAAKTGVDLPQISGGLLVRENVIEASVPIAVEGRFSHSEPQDLRYDLSNNTVFTNTVFVQWSGMHALATGRSEATQDVRVANNLAFGSRRLAYVKDEKDREVAATNWLLTNNAFSDDESTRGFLGDLGMNAAGLGGQGLGISTGSALIRLAAADRLATYGAGGDLPTYLGALPPGPAPPEGDWFTRLQERWKEAAEDLKRMEK